MIYITILLFAYLLFRQERRRNVRPSKNKEAIERMLSAAIRESESAYQWRQHNKYYKMAVADFDTEKAARERNK